MNESINQSINESMNQWINQSINQSINESTNQWINETCRPHLLKVIWTPQCVNMFMWNRALATVLCTFCRQLLQIEARDHGNRPYFATTEATLPEKTPGFAPGSLFKPEFTPFSCIFWKPCLTYFFAFLLCCSTFPFRFVDRNFPTCYTSQLLDDDDDGGENAAHDNRP